jgi:hypothetical protein
MPGLGGWHIAAGEAERGAAQAEIHIFQVRAESFFKEAHFFKNFAADEGGGPGWGMDFAFEGKDGGVGAGMAGAPGGPAATGQIVSSIELTVRPACPTKNFAGGERDAGFWPLK